MRRAALDETINRPAADDEKLRRRLRRNHRLTAPLAQNRFACGFVFDNETPAGQLAAGMLKVIVSLVAAVFTALTASLKLQSPGAQTVLRSSVRVTVNVACACAAPLIMKINAVAVKQMTAVFVLIKLNIKI